MTADIKKLLVDDIRSKITDFDFRKKSVEIAFKELGAFLQTPTDKETMDKTKRIFQYDESNSNKISPFLGTLTDEVANVYPLIEQLMKNIKLYNVEQPQVPEQPKSFGSRVSSMLQGTKQQASYTMVSNPMTIHVDLIVEVRALPKIWEVYLWNMRRRFILEAEYWQDVDMQKGNLKLERDYLFGMVEPRMRKLFMAAKEIIENNTISKESSILSRELSDEMKMFQPPTPPSGQASQSTPKQ